MVYRGGDQVGSWAYAGLIALGLSMTGIAMVAVPLSVIWLVLSIWLARRQERAEHERTVRSNEGRSVSLYKRSPEAPRAFGEYKME